MKIVIEKIKLGLKLQVRSLLCPRGGWEPSAHIQLCLRTCRRSVWGREPVAAAKGWAWVFQSWPPSFIRKEGSLDTRSINGPALRWNRRPGQSLVEPAIPTAASRPRWVPLLGDSESWFNQGHEGAPAVFPVCSAKLRGGANRTSSSKKRKKLVWLSGRGRGFGGHQKDLVLNNGSHPNHVPII